MFTSFLLALSVALGTPCEFEDSSNCVWNASQVSNHAGNSFIDIQGVAYYLEGK